MKRLSNLKILLLVQRQNFVISMKNLHSVGYSTLKLSYTH